MSTTAATCTLAVFLADPAAAFVQKKVKLFSSLLKKRRPAVRTAHALSQARADLAPHTGTQHTRSTGSGAHLTDDSNSNSNSNSNDAKRARSRAGVRAPELQGESQQGQPGRERQTARGAARLRHAHAGQRSRGPSIFSSLHPTVFTFSALASVATKRPHAGVHLRFLPDSRTPRRARV